MQQIVGPRLNCHHTCSVIQSACAAHWHTRCVMQHIGWWMAWQGHRTEKPFANGPVRSRHVCRTSRSPRVTPTRCLVDFGTSARAAGSRTGAIRISTSSAGAAGAAAQPYACSRAPTARACLLRALLLPLCRAHWRRPRRPRRRQRRYAVRHRHAGAGGRGRRRRRVRV